MYSSSDEKREVNLSCSKIWPKKDYHFMVYTFYMSKNTREDGEALDDLEGFTNKWDMSRMCKLLTMLFITHMCYFFYIFIFYSMILWTVTMSRKQLFWLFHKNRCSNINSKTLLSSQGISLNQGSFDFQKFYKYDKTLCHCHLLFVSNLTQNLVVKNIINN